MSAKNIRLEWANNTRVATVPLRLMHGTVRAVPAFGSEGSSVERASQYFSRVLTERHASGSGFSS